MEPGVGMSQHEGWARSRIYDCADVNDIIQILKTGYTLPNPADLLSLSLSPLSTELQVWKTRCGFLCALGN